MVQYLLLIIYSLTHLTNDVRRLGPLNSFSAFPYENNMFRKFCRKPGLPLQQISNRIAEMEAHEIIDYCNTDLNINVFMKHHAGPVQFCL